MSLMDINRKKITFNNFLSGVPARDYVFEDTPYDRQISHAARLLQEADYVLVGVGSGLSTAAGAQYGGRFFKEHFADFQAKYGTGPYMQDMYSAGFYPYPDEESFWGYFSKQALLAGIDLDVTPLYKTVLGILDGKKYFVLSTNTDKQFEKAGIDETKLFCTQGDYFHIQCAKPCHNKLYDAVEIFRNMDKARKNCVIPSSMVPKCPVCGGKMTMNLRADDSFVEDEAWHAAEERFGSFVTELTANRHRKAVLLELGVGFNTPAIIRFPFEKLVREYEHVSLVRLNLNEAVVQRSMAEREVGINADMKQSIEDIYAAMQGR